MADSAIRTVLVVEDDLATVTLIHDALGVEGYRVLHASGGAALDRARTERPAVILLDMHMPGMDGPEVARRLRADPATAAIPIVGMSAGLGRHGPPPGLPHDAWLPKPFALDDLVAVVARWAPADP